MTTSSTSTIEILRSEEKFATWLDYLEEIGPPPTPVILPSGDAFLAALSELDVPADDVETLVILRSEVVANADLWWLLERAVHSLLLRMDIVDSPPGFHPLPLRNRDLLRRSFMSTSML